MPAGRRHACRHACKPQACLHAAGMPAGMPQAGGAPAPSLGGGLLKALSESSKRLSKRFRLGSICLEKGRAGPFPRGWALKSFLRELDALSPSTGFAFFFLLRCVSVSVAVLLCVAFSAVLWSAKARSLRGPKKTKLPERRGALKKRFQ